MAIKSQYKYIGAGTLILSISLLLGWFASRSDFKVDFSPNITCSGECLNPSDSDCIGYFNITSLSKRFYIRNKGNLNLPFTEPEKVKSFQVYRADLRFKSDNPNRWKEFDFSKKTTLEVNKTNEFRLNLCKNNPSDDIKWGSSGFNFNEDPVFFGVNVEEIKTCIEKQTIVGNRVTISTVQILNHSVCDILNISCQIVNYKNLTSTISYDTTKIKNYTYCWKTAYRIDKLIINFSRDNYYCSFGGDYLVCDSVYDGNADGVCDSGETCTKIRISDLARSERLDTKSLKEIKIE